MTDLRIARKFLTKATNAGKTGVKFTLTFAQFKKLMMVKKCQYTGIILTEPTSTHQIATDRTIDRIDASKGYEVGNVLTACYAINQLKSMFENPDNPLKIEHLKRMVKKL